MSTHDSLPSGSASTTQVTPRCPTSAGVAPLLLPEHRSQGLGTAAQRLLVEYLFATTLANRLQAITDVENLVEQRALQRIGFRREGVMRGLAFLGGRWRDGVLYARLRDDRTEAR